MKKEFKIGLVGIIALVALFMGINFLKGKSLFNTYNEYYVRYTNAKGLTKSTVVYVDGYDAGIVTDVVYSYSNRGNVLVEISIDPNIVLCEGTQITVESDLMGGCTMNIVPTPLSDKRYLPGDTIQGYEEAPLMNQVEEMMPRINAITCKLDTLIGALNTLVSNPNLASILCNVEQMSANLTTTTEHINTFMGRDLPVLASTYNKVGENVRVITENLKSVDIQNTLDSVNMTISNVNAIMQQVSNPNGTLGALMYDRSLYNSLNKTVSTVDSLMTDIKARPKRYVHFSLFGSKTK